MKRTLVVEDFELIAIKLWDDILFIFFSNKIMNNFVDLSDDIKKNLLI
jgi:hypothetical protein